MSSLDAVPHLALARLVAAAKRAVVFTGAGISTESGIPDFRSPGGLWTKHQPIEFGEFVASAAARKEAWRRRFAMAEVFDAAVPNAGHLAVAELVRRGHVATVITQNIDGLHQASGVPEDRVVELHGSTLYARCLSCTLRHELPPIRAAFERTGEPPPCTACGGLLKTATISFGQAMPEGPMQRAEAATAACDVFIAAGSSLVVYPAAAFPAFAKRHGAKLVILNRDETDLDSVADLVIRGELGAVLGGLVERL